MPNKNNKSTGGFIVIGIVVFFVLGLLLLLFMGKSKSRGGGGGSYSPSSTSGPPPFDGGVRVDSLTSLYLRDSNFSFNSVGLNSGLGMIWIKNSSSQVITKPGTTDPYVFQTLSKNQLNNGITINIPAGMLNSGQSYKLEILVEEIMLSFYNFST